MSSEVNVARHATFIDIACLACSYYNDMWYEKFGMIAVLVHRAIVCAERAESGL